MVKSFLKLVHAYYFEVMLLKQWSCVKVTRHEEVVERIEGYQRDGWKLHTYNCIQVGVGADANHYLLFERGQ
jgi:hypothetical protein